MKRLTQKDEQGNWCIRGLPWKDIYLGAVITRNTYERIYGASWKLMEYEDTGLTPEQINALRERGINDGWIPADERLPEVGKYVLCTNKYGEVLVYRYGWNGPHTRKMFFHLCGVAANITAWRPLPEPYQPEQTTQRPEWKDRMLHTFLGGRT